MNKGSSKELSSLESNMPKYEGGSICNTTTDASATLAMVWTDVSILQCKFACLYRALVVQLRYMWLRDGNGKSRDGDGGSTGKL